jgi:hypothetical protein
MTQFSDAAWADMHPAMWAARIEARLLVREMFGEDLVITSGRRKATPGGSSLHLDGRAMDIRSKHWPAEAQRRFADKLQDILGEDFEVIVEGPASMDVRYQHRIPHIHIEYQPKGKHAERFTE